MTFQPSREEVRRLAVGGVSVPVYRRVLADIETPLSAYWKLAQDEPHSFLLESVTGGEQVGRYSVLGVPREVLRVGGDTALATPIEPGQDLLALLGNAGGARLSGVPAFVGGWVGMVAYDFARCIERLPEPPPDDLDLPLLALMRTGTVVVFDQAKNQVLIVGLADGTESGYDEAVRGIGEVEAKLAGPMPPLPTGAWPVHEIASNQTQSQFEAAVQRIREYIEAGDCIQAVPSVRLSTEVDAHPVTVYRALRSVNPSPYMFLLRFGDFDLVGASPELLVSLHDREARVRPIAGTRKRGDSLDHDELLAKELLADEKERAEHVMLVDLGRNDLGKVCKFGSIQVRELMQIERYSHVMHIVSDIVGELEDDKGALDLVRACFPAGTVSGAPKVRAMQIISELESVSRGPYAGAVGFLSHTGDMDLCIAIRTILMRDGRAFVQAGAGIVHDSIPASEWEECQNKVRAALRAIELAQLGLSEI